MASTYTPIATQTLGSAAASVTFSSIPSTYTDLVLILNGYNATVDNASPRIRFNSDAGANYSETSLYGDGTSAGSTRGSNDNQLYAGYQRGWSTTSTNRATNIVQILNYSNSTTKKTMLSRANVGNSIVESIVGLWSSTAAISQIDVFAAGTFAAGSTFSLYGIKAA